jgi:uncharacterized membrane protein
MKSRLSIALLGILVFLLGGVAGAASFYLYCEHIRATVPTISKVEDVVEEMAQELQLNAQQKAAVIVIISDIRNRYRALSQEFRPRWQELRRESDDRINALLREDQKPRFEKFLERYKTAAPASSQPASSK